MLRRICASGTKDSSPRMAWSSTTTRRWDSPALAGWQGRSGADEYREELTHPLRAITGCPVRSCGRKGEAQLLLVVVVLSVARYRGADLPSSARLSQCNPSTRRSPWQ